MAKNVQAPGSNIGLIRRSSRPYGTENSRGGIAMCGDLGGMAEGAWRAKHDQILPRRT